MPYCLERENDMLFTIVLRIRNNSQWQNMIVSIEKLENWIVFDICQKDNDKYTINSTSKLVLVIAVS
jgi:hypothetical protein